MAGDYAEGRVPRIVLNDFFSSNLDLLDFAKLTRCNYQSRIPSVRYSDAVPICNRRI